jgi:hypothetical protein
VQVQIMGLVLNPNLDMGYLHKCTMGSDVWDNNVGDRIMMINIDVVAQIINSTVKGESSAQRLTYIQKKIELVDYVRPRCCHLLDMKM